MEASSAGMRAVLIGGQPLLFQPLARWLTHERAITAEFLDAGDPAVVERCAALAADVAVIDQTLAPAVFPSIVAGLRGSLPGIAILLLAERADPAAEATALAAGCRGVVGKDQAAETLVSALCDARGMAVPAGGAGPQPFVPTLRLTLREREVLGLLAAGLSTPRIGKELHIAHNTARAHVQRVIEKLGAHSKLEAVALARRAGMFAS